MEKKKCKKCSKELENNKGIWCGKCKSEFIDRVLEIGGAVAGVVVLIVTKGKFKPKG